MTTAVQKIVETLLESGIEYVFTHPGGPVRPIIDGLYDHQDKIRVVLCRDEQTASCMAESYGQMTGKPGVFMAQEGFVCSTGMFGILQAYLASSPMLVMTGFTDYGTFAQHAPFQSGSGQYGSFDARAILKEATKFTALATTPLEAVHGVQLAIKHATSGRPGPAAVIWKSVAMGELVEDSIPRIYPLEGYLGVSKPTASPEVAHEVAQKVLDAENPVLLAGNGARASRAHAELRQLAEKIGMPVVTTTLGKSVLRESHPLAAGPMGGTGSPLANSVIGEADLLLIVGTRLKPQDTLLEHPKLIDPTRQTLIQVDIDSRNVGWQFPVDVGVTADAQVFLEQLLKEIDRTGKNGLEDLAASRSRLFQERKQKERVFDRPDLVADGVPIPSGKAVQIIREVLEPSAIVTTDGGNNRHWMLRLFETRDEETYFGNAGLGGMSYSIYAAMTAKLLNPDRQCVAVAGDGGFMMKVNALATALQHGINFVGIVFNDSALGMVKEAQGTRSYASEFMDFDFAAIARGFGCFGVKVNTSDQLYKGLRDALNAGRPAVVDVAVSKEERAQSILASPLRAEMLRAVRQKGLL